MKKEEDLVSIIMPSYNCEEIIKKSIDSVLNQTYSNWELIIVDDCSTDKTETTVLEYIKKSNKIKFYKLKKNSGAAIARNKAIELSKGKYIAFLDSDDCWKQNKLSLQISFMKENNIYFSSTGYELYDENGNSLKKAIIPPKKVNYNKFVFLSCPVGNLTVIYNAEKLGKIYAPNIRKRNDFALWLQILKKTEYCYGMSEILANYTVGRSGSLSKNKFKLMKYHWILYREIEKHSVIKSIIEVISWGIVKLTGIGRKTIRL